MTAKLFNGRKVSQEILEELGAKIAREKIQPVLAVILIGENDESKLYVKLKKEAAGQIGIEVLEYQFSDRTREEEIVRKIKELNNDDEVHGIIVQLPLPANFNKEKIIETLNPAKDVDAFHSENRRLLQINKGGSEAEALLPPKPYFFPVLPAAILLALRRLIGNNLKNKKIVALVNSEIFGQVLKLVFKKEGAEINYLLRSACSVPVLEEELRSADILITVCGCANLIKKEMIKKGAILIDAGITRSQGGRVIGDIDRKDIEKKAAFLTPVPGGIGPLTVALLLQNVYLAALKTKGRDDKSRTFSVRQKGAG